jgi:hypothetical protein
MNQESKFLRFKAHCPTCARKTNHEVLCEHWAHYTPDNTEMSIDFAKGTWQIIRCMGCEAISFRESWFTSEDDYSERGQEGTEYRYPKVGPEDLSEKRFVKLPSKIRRLYSEIIETYNHGLFIACTILIRSIIEAIANEHPESLNLPDITPIKAKKGSIEWKILKLTEQRILSKSHGEILNESRYFGNRAVHELEAPPQNELKELIKIIEETLYMVFDISEKLDELKCKHGHHNKQKKTF